jgi:hypothetical protein
LILSLCIGLQAQSVSQKAREFVDKSKLESSKNLISFLFSNENKYYDKNGDMDFILILKTLQDNGLLNLSFKEPQDLELAFVAKQNPLIFMRVITESLNSMGYNFFMTKKVLRTPEEFAWRITLSTQNAPNPLMLNEALKARGCDIVEIKKDDDVWTYIIDSQNAKIDAIYIEPNKRTELKKPFSPYLITLEGSTKTIAVEARQSDHWHPKVSFYDNNLHLIKIEDIDKRQSVLRLKVPQNSAYVKIDDKYTLDNIKRGVSVTLEQ